MFKKKKKGEEKSLRGPCDWPVVREAPSPSPPPHSRTSPGATVTSCRGIS